MTAKKVFLIGVYCFILSSLLGQSPPEEGISYVDTVLYDEHFIPKGSVIPELLKRNKIHFKQLYCLKPNDIYTAYEVSFQDPLASAKATIAFAYVPQQEMLGDSFETWIKQGEGKRHLKVRTCRKSYFRVYEFFFENRKQAGVIYKNRKSFTGVIAPWWNYSNKNFTCFVVKKANRLYIITSEMDQKDSPNTKMLKKEIITISRKQRNKLR